MVGKTKTIHANVTAQTTALFIKSGELEVLSTPSLIAFMEQAASELVSEDLDPAQTSVGTKLAIEHVAASPVGAIVSATATILSQIGRRIELELSATDEQGTLLGRGTHHRVIVDKAGFMAKLENK